MRGANRLATGFTGGVLAFRIGAALDKYCSSFWLGVALIVAVAIFILILCELISKDDYSGTWINGVEYDLNGIEICSFPQKDGSVDYTVGYASHRQLLTKEQAKNFKDLVKSLKTGTNSQNVVN